MSTRLRIIFTYPGGQWFMGSLAIVHFLNVVKPSTRRRALLGIEGNKRAKLEELAKKLPPRYSLTLIQEPRRTRKNRSLYWARVARRDEPIWHNAGPAAAPAAALEQNGNPIQAQQAQFDVVIQDAVRRRPE